MSKNNLSEAQVMQALENCNKPCCNGCPLINVSGCEIALTRAAKQLLEEKNELISEIEGKLKKVLIEVEEAKKLYESDIAKAAEKAVTDFSNALKQLDTGFDGENGFYMIESEKWDKLLEERVDGNDA